MSIPGNHEAYCFLCNKGFTSKMSLDKHFEVRAEAHKAILGGAGDAELAKRQMPNDSFRYDPLLVEMFDGPQIESNPYPPSPDIDEVFRQVQERKTSLAGEAAIKSIMYHDLVRSVLGE